MRDRIHILDIRFLFISPSLVLLYSLSTHRESPGSKSIIDRRLNGDAAPMDVNNGSNQSDHQSGT